MITNTTLEAARSLGAEAKRRGAEAAIPESHNPNTPDADAELVALAKNIRSWQLSTSPRLSDEAMLRQYPALGSTKTYRRLRDGDTDGLIPANQLPKYRGVWHQIETNTGMDGREEIYFDIAPASECRAAVAGLLPQKGKTRLVIIEGPTGSGKTTSLEIVGATYAGQCVSAEADETWTNPNIMLGGILVAMGCYRDLKDEKMPSSRGLRLDEIIATARKGRMIFLLDEGHHLNASGLNLIKTILNKTDSVFVVACIDTLWRKLAAKSWEEAKQLVLNRLHERVILGTPSADDAGLFLTRRVPGLSADAVRPVIGKIVEAARHNGHFAYLRRLAKKLQSCTSDINSGQIAATVEALNLSLKTR